jgi:hypothetical protein
MKALGRAAGAGGGPSGLCHPGAAAAISCVEKIAGEFVPVDPLNAVGDVSLFGGPKALWNQTATTSLPFASDRTAGVFDSNVPIEQTAGRNATVSSSRFPSRMRATDDSISSRGRITTLGGSQWNNWSLPFPPTMPSPPTTLACARSRTARPVRAGPLLCLAASHLGDAIV